MRVRRHSGFTFVECLIAVAITLVSSTMLLTATICLSRTFVCIGNYVTLNRQARGAMDMMSRDIRQAAGLVSGGSSYLNFTNYDGSALQYQYNTSAKTLTYTNGFNGQSGTLLWNCVSCSFSMFLRSPVPGSCMAFTNIATSSGCKVIEVNWVCQTTNLFSLNSEMVETTRITLRN